jgi:hypothetical protein
MIARAKPAIGQPPDVCSENNAHIRVGNEPYYLSADGKLMPRKKGQAPPDLSYFKQTGK